MIRKAFIHASSLLHSSNKNDIKKLKSTIEFLTKGDTSSNTLNKMIQNKRKPRNNDRSSLSKMKPTVQEQEYINTILKILNSVLPSQKNHVQRIETHYRLFFKQLETILNQFANYNVQLKGKNNHNYACPFLPISLQDNVDYKTMKSDDLLNRLILLQLIDKLTLRDTTQIILSRNFNQYDKTFQNLPIFSKRDQLNISVLLYYKLKSCEKSCITDTNDDNNNNNNNNFLLISKIWDQYSLLWIKDFDELHPSMKRIFWRCIYMTYPLLINDIIQYKLKRWDMNNLVILYQSLFQYVHKLDLPNVSHNNSLVDNNFKNQELFIKVINLLSPFKKIHRTTMIKIVKLSIQSHLSEPRQENNPERIGSQLMFATSLDLTLKKKINELECSQDVDNNKLKEELGAILKIIDKQEDSLKEQISLKFV